MKEVDIKTLVNICKLLNKNLPNNISIIGKIDLIIISYKYEELALSKVECNKIIYRNQEEDSIKNHILPNSLKYLLCSYNQLTSLPYLPNSLKILWCENNQLISLPNLPNSLEKLYCYNNRLTSLPDLPNSLKNLSCFNNKLTSLPDFTHIDHKIGLSFNQDNPIKYIPYNTNIELYELNTNKINIEGYPHNPITNQEELNKYMDYVKNYEMNRIKSARK